jgi:tetratricopeptide (TPR) repeat protein
LKTGIWSSAVFVGLLFAPTLFVGRASLWAQTETPPGLTQARQLANKGRWPKAKSAYQELMNAAACQPNLTAECLATAQEFTQVLITTSDWPTAEAWQQKIIDFRVQQDGDAAPILIEERRRLVDILFRAKDYLKATEACSQMVRTVTRVRGRNPSLDLVDAMEWTARIEMAKTNIDSAIAIQIMAIQSREELQGSQTVDLLPSLDRLGGWQITNRDYPAAVITFQKALTIRERNYGQESSDLFGVLEGLAYAQFGDQKLELAEATYQRLIALWIKHTDVEHPMVAIKLDLLASLYREWKQAEKYSQTVEQAIGIRAKFLGRGLATEASHRQTKQDAQGAADYYRWAARSIHNTDPALKEQLEKLAHDLAPLSALPKTPPTAKSKAKAK